LAIFGLGGLGKFPLKISNLSIFSIRVKKNLNRSGQKVPYLGQRQGGLLFTAGQKYVQVGSGSISTFSRRMRFKILPYPPQRPKRSEGRMLRNSLRDRGKIKFSASVTTISSYSFEARGLKFGMKIYLINAVKLISQIFEFCL